MNPFNLIISYFIANSRAEYYNIKDPQEIQKTGLIAGMISTNPIISYLLIENKAKELQVIPERNPTLAGIATQANTLPPNPVTPAPNTPAPNTTTPDPVLTKLEEVNKKLGENQTAIGELSKKIDSIEKSTQENKVAVDRINIIIAELPKVVLRIDALDKKMSELSNTKSIITSEVKSLPKK